MRSTFEWKTGEPSEITKALVRTQTTPTVAADSTTKKKHPLRGAEAQKIGSTSRAATANISEKDV